MEKFAADFKAKGYPLHCLILNAGIFLVDHEKTPDGFEVQKPLAPARDILQPACLQVHVETQWLYHAPVVYMLSMHHRWVCLLSSCISCIMLICGSIKMLCMHAQITQKTNHFGLFLLALLLADKLKESAPARMVWVASPAETFSGNIDWDDLKCAL